MRRDSRWGVSARTLPGCFPPESIRWQARQLLRHYPTRKEMLLAGQVEEKLAEGTLFQPTFSSSIDE